MDALKKLAREAAESAARKVAANAPLFATQIQNGASAVGNAAITEIEKGSKMVKDAVDANKTVVLGATTLSEYFRRCPDNNFQNAAAARELFACVVASLDKDKGEKK